MSKLKFGKAKKQKISTMMRTLKQGMGEGLCQCSLNFVCYMKISQ